MIPGNNDNNNDNNNDIFLLNLSTVMFAFNSNSAANSTVIFGDTERVNGSSTYRQETTAIIAYTHPDFVVVDKNDIALLYLDPPLNITDCVRPICVNQLTNEWKVYTNCWIVGWGDSRIAEGNVYQPFP